MIGSKIRAFYRIVLFCSITIISQNSYAAGWFDLPYDHFSKDEDLVALLNDFSSTVGIPIKISERILDSNSKLVNGHFKNVTAELFLMKLSNLYQIVWYYDGHMLFIYHADELKSELLHFSDAKSNGVRSTLKRLGVWDPRFNWREMREKNLLFISGPPRYLELVKEIAQVIEANMKKEKDTTYVVRIFHLNYASAEDKIVSHRGNEVTIPGVATTIKNILGGGSAERGAKQEATKKKGLKGTGMVKQKVEEDESSEEFLHNSGENSYIEANGSQNAIIVYDLASRMSMYEDIINSLDVKSEQIEIEVSIIDINTERLQQIGIDWANSGSNGRFGFGNANNIANESLGGLSHTFGVNPGESPSSVLMGNADYFLGKVRLLAEDGEGQVLSQPSVMTMDNIEAIIDHSTTFYVRLEGVEEVDLVPISAGSVLKVTPRIVSADEITQIHLNVEIEDGRVASVNQETDVDGVPSVVSSTITTQALIDQDSSLLVGGYFYDSSDFSENKVPLLGDVPILKRLFNSERKSRRKMARMFLITPRIIVQGSAHEKGKRIRETLDKDRSFEKKKYQKPRYELFDYADPSGLNIYD